MRSFSKKLAFVLAAAMVVTAFAPAAKAEAAKEMAINKSSQILYVNEGINHKGADGVAAGKGNVSVYDFSVKNKPADWKTAYSFAWSSSDEDVVSVAKGGVATAVGVGKATVYCKVTEKATKEVTTLKTKVTVKANAYDVEITNADKWDGATVEVNGVVDLNRAMYDEDGNKTTKRGTLVTDYTQWVAEPAAGVEIDQKTGKFTFTEAAVAGEYKLSCYTYQSSKYTKATATSDPVVVEFVNGGFEVDQTAVNGFNILFNKTADVKIADVTVNKIIKVGDSTGKLPQVVSNVTMSEDKKTASVSLFTNLVNGETYEVSVKGSDEVVSFVAYVGKPATMTVSSKSDMQNGTLVYINNLVGLTYKLFDDQGNDVTNASTATGYVLFSTANATSSDYYVSGDQLYVYKEGVEVAVNAEYHTGEYDNTGKETVIKATGYFMGVSKAVDTVAEVTLTPKRWGSQTYANNQIPAKDFNITAELKIKTTQQYDQLNTYTNGQYIAKLDANPNDGVNEPIVQLRSSNPDVLDIIYADGVDRIELFKEGVSAILVDLVTTNADGSKNVNTIAATYVTVVPARKATNLTVGGNGLVTVGNQAGFNSSKLNVTVTDQYNEAQAISRFTDVKLVDGTAIDASCWSLESRSSANGWQDGIVINSGILQYAPGGDFPAGKNEVTFNVVAKAVVDEYRWDYFEKEFFFRVTVKKPTSASNLAVEATGNTSGNAGRFVTPYDGNGSTEDVKAAKFSVYTMSNGIKVSQEPVAKRLSNAVSGGAIGELFFTVTHDGTDITALDQVRFDGNTVVVDYSALESKHMTDGVNGADQDVVTYSSNYKNLGAGTYVFTLYKVVAGSGENKTYAYVSSASTTVTCDTGNYTFVKRTSEDATHTNANGVSFVYDPSAQYGLYNGANQSALRDCFQIKNRDGQDATAKYFVTAIDAIDYVYVDYITFFESLEYNVYDNDGNVVEVVNEGEYASYKVDVKVSLKK